MADTVKLRNRDGAIVGVDPETGEEVPIEFGDVSIDGTSFAPDVVETEPNTYARSTDIDDRTAGTLSQGARFLGSTFYHEPGTVEWSGSEEIDRINIRPQHHPPELVPIVYVDAEVRTQGNAKSTLRVAWHNGRAETVDLRLGVSGASFTRGYTETYLADPFEGTGTGRKKSFPSLVLSGSTAADRAQARNIRVGLEYEVR